MRRRRIIAGLMLSLVAPLPAEAQKAGKVFKIGYLGGSSAAAMELAIRAFRQHLQDLGWVEGKNITLEMLGRR
jgi:hypothetical protein